MAPRGVRTLVYAIRINVVAKYLGQLCGVLAALTLVPLAVTLGLAEYATGLRYLMVAAVLALVSFVAARLQAPAGLQANEALVITVLAFLLGAAAMVYPFMGAGLNLENAIFEAVSGVTTTGLSTLPSVAEHSHAFLFSRAWLQWYGGLGIVVLCLALLIGPGAVARRLAGAGGDIEDLAGTSRVFARRMAVIYGLLTVLGILIVALASGDLFVAVIHVLSAVSTGGFSGFDDSLAGLDGWSARAAILGLSLAGAIPFALYFQTWNRGWRHFFGDREIQIFMMAILLITLLLWASLRAGQHLTGLHALAHAAAMALSAQTTTGFATLDTASLDAGAKGAMIMSMALGGGMGSTAGGIKIVRLLILLSVLRILLLRTALPERAVVEPKLQGHRLGESEIQRALLVIILYVLIILLSWLPFLAYGYDPLDALFEVVSATATVGLSTGISSAGLEPVLKGILCLDMLLGRLEIFALLVLLAPGTWMGRRRNGS